MLVARWRPAAITRRSLLLQRESSRARANRVLPGRFERGALGGTFRPPRPDEPGPTELLCLFHQLVELAARVPRRTRNHESANLAPASMALSEERERGVAKWRGQVRDLHPGAQVGLVRSVLRDRLRVRQPQERMRRVAADQPQQPIHQRLDRREHELLGRERNLEIDLRELRLPIGAQIFVAEALDDLEIPVHSGDHQDLLEQLRRLRQRVELARVHAARHQIVARAFRRRFGEHRRLDFEEPFASKYFRISIVARCRSVMLYCMRGRRRSRYRYFSRVSSETVPSSAIGNGGVFASFSSRTSRSAISISPVLSFGFTDSGERRSTRPMTATTYSGRSRCTASMSAGLSRATTCVIPCRSRMSRSE